MAGHSKWANIKHRKERQDAKKGKIFTLPLLPWGHCPLLVGRASDLNRRRRAQFQPV